MASNLTGIGSDALARVASRHRRGDARQSELARTIHEPPTATADLAALSVVLAIRDLGVPFKYACGSESLRAPAITASSTVSLRRFKNNPG
jgi:hypothetical protein